MKFNSLGKSTNDLSLINSWAIFKYLYLAEILNRFI